MTKAWSTIGSVAGLCAVAWSAGLVWFAATIPTAVPDPDTHTDAIVVLTGGSERIETGLKLLSEGRSEQLYISGVGSQLTTGELLSRAASDPQLGTRISTGTATNTPGNAAETADWVEAHHVMSIRLVTAGYHMRRSLLELHSAMPQVTIIPNPVFPAHVKSDWWRWPGTASLIAREYSKFAVTWIWQQLGLEDELPRVRAAGAARVKPTPPSAPTPAPTTADAKPDEPAP
jgi:uncharacterized SAM-binding protein YcdF (DUF218 family)